MSSSLFSLCPACRVRANLAHVGAGYRCLSCNFDFTTLANDPGALERWLSANLLDGSVEMSITLYHLITGVREPEARARVLAFASQRGIAMPKGGIGGIVIAVVVGLVVLLAGIIAVVYAVSR